MPIMNTHIIINNNGHLQVFQLIVLASWQPAGTYQVCLILVL